MDIKKEMQNLKTKVSEKINKAKESRNQKREWAKEFTEANKGKCCRLVSKEVNGKVYKIIWIFNLEELTKNDVLPCYTITGKKLVELYPKSGEIFFKHFSCLYDADDDLQFFESPEEAENDLKEKLSEYLSRG